MPTRIRLPVAEVEVKRKKTLGEDKWGQEVLSSKSDKRVANYMAKLIAQKEAAAAGAGKAKPTAVQADAVNEDARRKFTRIDAFEGPFEFLSPDSEAPAAWAGILYKTARHAALAAQFPDVATTIFGADTVEAASAVCRDCAEAPEWDGLRLKIVERIQRDKFRRNLDLRTKLKETGTRDFVWGEDGDEGFWGETGVGNGLNHLGRILMKVRRSIQEDTELEEWLLDCCQMESQAMKRPPVELLEVKDTAENKTQLYRLDGEGKACFRLGKLPTNDIVALHPSVSREHARLLHTSSSSAKHGLVLIDMGSKAGTSINDKPLKHPLVPEPVLSGDIIRLGASTRHYKVKINLQSQIEQLERAERELLRDANTLNKDAADPLAAAQRAAKDESTVFVGGLDYETEKADLLSLFQDCGHIEEVRFPGPPGSTKAVKGICFVLFESGFVARRACGLNGESFKNRKIKVAPANEGGRQREDDEGHWGMGRGKGKGKGKRQDHDDRGGGFDGQRGPSPKGDSRALYAQTAERSREMIQENQCDRRRQDSREGSRHIRNRSQSKKPRERRKQASSEESKKPRDRRKRDSSPASDKRHRRKRGRSALTLSDSDKRGRRKGVKSRRSAISESDV